MPPFKDDGPIKIIETNDATKWQASGKRFPTKWPQIFILYDLYGPSGHPRDSGKFNGE